ncbi:hypothetical protein QK290_02385 [Pseudarthrobacter sp. AL07]|uniref:hypothetical protein n=1 Tax=unclassified Pseudarthrobacter TaxID=2647000 RepID=UPI00249AF51A|nr:MULTISPECIES: hypothetical protein [unclassified Pseudarthrobacter]MDI3193326.1 hypothetical protein [Pseudarthrobacter sp. AL20]MDI3207394.1 hypothetical protein [Pseudarthrobacter sp. AL07]
MSNPQEPYQPVQPAAWPAQPAGQPGNPGQHGAPPLPGNPPHGAPGQNGAPGQYGPPSQFGPPAQYGAPGQYSPDGPFGLPGQEPPARNRRKLWTILGIMGGVLLLAVVGVLILVNVVNGATNHARGLADGFTKLVIAGDSSKAYDDYLDPALREQLTKEEFIAGIKTLEMDNTCKPAYNQVTASTENGTKAADVAGLITCDGDKKIDLAYRFEGTDELRMINIKLKPQS